MKWIEPKHSKERVKKAGKQLLEEDIESDEFKEAVPIFHNWRSSHAFPMQIMLDLLRKNAVRIDRDAVAVQRLKRVASIFNKLVREENMSLSRMEDIAGCRVVVKNTSHVNRVYLLLKKSRTKNKLQRERNYIEYPKESGYRGIHLIYRYQGRKKAYNGMSVELQLRSKIQHSWATAVEVVGTFTKQALKASSGEDAWLNLFKYASAEFSKLEGCAVDVRFDGIDTFTELDKLVISLELFERLAAFKVATKALTDKKFKGAGYFVVVLDLEEKVVNHTRYAKKEIDNATNHYNDLEDEYKDDSNRDVVLVSAESVRDLKRAYPNYFADTTQFEKNISQVYEANKLSKRDAVTGAPS